MSWSEILVVAFALSVDALVCSIITGKTSCKNSTYITTGLAVAFSFGFFQFFMPLLGFYGGKQLQETLASFDHWVAFLLLAGVGGNMLKEAYQAYKEDHDTPNQQTKEADIDCHSKGLLQISLLALLSMAIGTSIDALAVGVSYGLLSNTILLCATIIGLICLMCSLLGFFLGKVLSSFIKLDPILNLLGALVLIGIGINILIEHQALLQIKSLLS